MWKKGRCFESTKRDDKLRMRVYTISRMSISWNDTPTRMTEIESRKGGEGDYNSMGSQREVRGVKKGSEDGSYSHKYTNTQTHEILCRVLRSSRGKCRFAGRGFWDVGMMDGWAGSGAVVLTKG